MSIMYQIGTYFWCYKYGQYMADDLKKLTPNWGAGYLN